SSLPCGRRRDQSTVRHLPYGLTTRSGAGVGPPPALHDSVRLPIQRSTVSSQAHDVVAPSAPSARVAFEPPEEVDDYVILRKLGQGATGQVYLAEDSVLARTIAIKFIGVDPDPAARQRFLMEARAAARIQHPNVVSIYRVGELGDQPYIVSELVRGTPLS